VDAQPLVPRRQLGVIAAAGAAGVREDQDALLSSMKPAVSARLAEAARFSTTRRRRPLADDAPRAARHLGHHVGAEALDDLVERAGHRRQEASCSISSSRRATASRLSTGWPSR
jgi:hypothetical protein